MTSMGKIPLLLPVSGPGKYCRMIVLAISCLTFLPPAGAQSGSVPVASGSKAQAVIVVGESAGQSARFAAHELKEYLRKLSGADVATMTDRLVSAGSPQQSWILIGGPDQNRLVKQCVDSGLKGFSGLKSDGFVLKTSRLDKRPVVVAGGNDEAGTMYAVFELAKQLGVTFLLTGDIVPAIQPSLEIPAGSSQL
jgi:alpha-glucuronidase